MAEITRAESWEAVRAAHRWLIPDDYNLAWDMCEKWARSEPDRLALVHVTDEAREYTFRDLSRRSSQLANVLLAHGIGRGDGSACCCLRRPRPCSAISRPTVSAR